MEDDVILKCSGCGAIKIAIKDGVETFAHCICDYSKSLRARLSRTLHPQCWENGLRGIWEWSPALLAAAKSPFPNFMRIQKAEAIRKIHEFAFQKTNGKHEFEASILKGRNLLIRGPEGTDKSLFSSTLKILCAMLGKDATPLPGDFDIFKSDIQSSEHFSKEGDEARIRVIERYEAPPLMLLDNVRAVTKYSLSPQNGGRMQREVRGVDQIDRLLASRQTRTVPGCIVLISTDFAGQIGDTLGERMSDMLASSKTERILLFTPTEVSSIKVAIRRKLESNQSICRIARGEDQTKSDKDSEKKRSLELYDALYFEAAFGAIDAVAEVSGLAQQIKAFAGKGKYPEKMVSEYQRFLSEKEAKGIEWEEGIRRSCLSWASSPWTELMTPQELEETGRMVILACQGDEAVQKIVKNASSLRDEMRGS